MFKELGEFMDNAGRRVGFIAKKLLSKDEPHGMCGVIDNDVYIDIDELVEQGIISKEEGEAMKSIEVAIDDNE